MRTQARIEQSIQENLPIIFGTSESDQSALKVKYNALIDYLVAVSEPFLTTETIRYQSILLYLSLLIVSARLFRISTLKIAESPVLVDRRLLISYTIFMALSAAIFWIKASADFRRKALALHKYGDPRKELTDFIEILTAKRVIQEYFFWELRRVIGDASAAYDRAISEAWNRSSTSGYTIKNPINLDLQKVGDVSVLATEFTAQESNLALINAELAEDEARFSDMAKTILIEARSQPDDDPMWEPADLPSARIEDAYAQRLRNWIEAEKVLTDKFMLPVMKDWPDIPEIREHEKALAVLGPTLKLRREYHWLEIYAPLVFTVLAILYGWFK